MKLQNTLFIATAICFYILLCSKPADAEEELVRELCHYAQIYHNKMCTPKGPCPSGTHECLISTSFGDMTDNCKILLDEDIAAAPDCGNSRTCKNSKTCYAIFRYNRNPMYRCIGPKDFDIPDILNVELKIWSNTVDDMIEDYLWLKSISPVKCPLDQLDAFYKK